QRPAGPHRGERRRDALVGGVTRAGRVKEGGGMEKRADETAERWAPPWWGVFLVGLLLWVATIAVGRVTHNVILLPTIVLLGSFLVPITAVVWYLGHDPSPELSRAGFFTPSLSGAAWGRWGRPCSNTGWSALASSERLRSG